MEIKENVLKILEEADRVMTERLNWLRDNFDCFYLTTDEILAYKHMVYSGEFAKYAVALEDIYGEDYARVVLPLNGWYSDFELSPILKKVRDRMVRFDVVMGKTLGQCARKQGAPISDKLAGLTIAQFVDEDKTELQHRLIEAFDKSGLYFDRWNVPVVDPCGGIKKQADPKAPRLLAEYEFLNGYAEAFALSKEDLEELKKYGISGPTLLMCSTTSDILRQVKDINFREQLLRHTPLILNGKIAEQIRKEKRQSMPVWEGKLPEGEALKMFQIIRAGEIARQGAVVGDAERAVIVATI
ncbi:MAG: hypothetical protein J6J23_00540 [Clostridia bacterium]|nr:hypothetical protein [Clostridia bacterium]